MSSEPLPVSPEEARQLLHRCGGAYITDISDFLDLQKSGLFIPGLSHAYQLHDGRVLILEVLRPDGSSLSGDYRQRREDAMIDCALLYKSREAVQHVAKEIEDERVKLRQQPGRTHILDGVVQEDFVLQVPALISQLALHLHLPPEALNESIESLRQVDEAARVCGYLRCLEVDIFASLVAYAGAVIKQAVLGKWSIESYEDSKTWLVYIVDTRGRRYNPWNRLYDALSEDEFPCPTPISWAVQKEIQAPSG